MPVTAQENEAHRQDLRKLVAAEGISNFGSMLSRLAIPWIASLTLQATPAQMAGLVAADIAAGAFGALWLGPRVDRSAKRRVMRACDGSRALLLCALAGLALLQTLTMTLLVAAAMVAGVLNVAFDLARSAWVAQSVPEAELPRANAALSAAGSVSETVAFASGGWLYQWAGAVWALLGDAASFALSALLLRGVKNVPAQTSPRIGSRWQAWWREQREGWATLAQHPLLRALATVEGLRAMGFGLVGTSYMVFVSRELGLPTGVQGLLFALGAVGALIGAALAPRLTPSSAMAWGLLLSLAAALCLPLAHGAGWVAMALIAAQQIVGDAGDTLYDVHDQSLRQSSAPAAQLARVDAGIRTVGQLGTLAGAALGGLVGTLLSPRAALLGGAIAFGLALAWLLFAGQRPQSPAPR